MLILRYLTRVGNCEEFSENGKIYFLMTLFEKKGFFNELAGKVKPYLKYLTSIDFGKITY